MERALQENNRLLSATLDELRALYDSLNRDLLEAKMLQQSLVRERHRSFANGDVSLLLRPSGHVGGDLVGFFPINARRVGLFSLDVSGHGIASALMTARLAGFLSGTAPEQNVALHVSEYGIYDGRPPAEVAATLNRMVLGEITTGAYFTLLYADVDLVSGAVELVQAGHPHPLVQRADGRIEPLGEGGLPVGLLAEARYEGVSARLFPGDRLLIMSDGLTEARNATGAELGVEGLATLMTRRRGVSGPAFLQALAADLSAWSGAEPSDDLSAVLFEFRGPKENIG
jgi:sigma-B regulation protein RsbU (phosphoserine phosphatase)